MSAPFLSALLLGDGRFPAGGHVHSAGVESAIADGRVTGEESLEAYVVGRLTTVGIAEAALAAATAWRLDDDVITCEPSAVFSTLDAEADARIPVPSLRGASRRLGRQLARVGGRCWPDPRLAVLAQTCPDGAHLPVAMGAVGLACGLGPSSIAHLALHHAATTPTQAAVRLLGLDPFGAVAIAARLAPLADQLAREAVAAASGPLEDLPARSGPVVEMAAVDHPTWDVRMFAT